MKFSEQMQQFEDQEFRRESRRIEALEDEADRRMEEEYDKDRTLDNHEGGEASGLAEG
jgi:hypothetical protein